MKRAWSSFELDAADPISVGRHLHGDVQISMGNPKSDVRVTLNPDQAEELRVKLDLYLKHRMIEEGLAHTAVRPQRSATVTPIRAEPAANIVAIPFEGGVR